MLNRTPDSRFLFERAGCSPTESILLTIGDSLPSPWPRHLIEPNLSANTTTTLSITMRTDLLSKRFFAAGCFGLPWLWVVHVLYSMGNQEQENEGIVNPDDHFQDDPTEATQDEIKREATLWVQRCKICASVFVVLWIAWIVCAQVFRSVLPASLYMLNADDAALTGW
jgi:hypothetical protein